MEKTKKTLMNYIMVSIIILTQSLFSYAMTADEKLHSSFSLLVKNRSCLHEEAVIDALQQGANPNYIACDREQKQWTPLIYACKTYNIDFIKTLLQSEHINTNFATDESTPLMIACVGQNKTIVQLLLDNGADPNQRTTRSDISCSVLEFMGLHYYGNMEIIELLIDHGLDISKETACQHNGWDSRVLLLNTYAQDTWNTSYWSYDWFGLLTSWGVDLSEAKQVKHIVGALLHSCWYEKKEGTSGKKLHKIFTFYSTIIEKLLQLGVSADEPCGGVSPLMIALATDARFVRLLLYYAVNPYNISYL